MTEIPLATRITPELEKALEEYMRSEHLEKSAAVRRLLYAALARWREEYALQLLREGKTTVSKGAEIAGMDIWSFMALIREKRVEWVDEEIIKKDLRAFS